MTKRLRICLQLLLVLAATVALVLAAGTLWRLGERQPAAGSAPSISPQNESPLSTPTAEPSMSLFDRGVALLWVVLGVFLAGGILFLIRRLSR